MFFWTSHVVLRPMFIATPVKSFKKIFRYITGFCTGKKRRHPIGRFIKTTHIITFLAECYAVWLLRLLNSACVLHKGDSFLFRFFFFFFQTRKQHGEIPLHCIFHASHREIFVSFVSFVHRKLNRTRTHAVISYSVYSCLRKNSTPKHNTLCYQAKCS